MSRKTSKIKTVHAVFICSNSRMMIFWDDITSKRYIDARGQNGERYIITDLVTAENNQEETITFLTGGLKITTAIDTEHPHRRGVYIRPSLENVFGVNLSGTDDGALFAELIVPL